MDLGCTPLQSFFKVTIHEIMPGIVSGAIMAFTMSLDDFVISYFVTGPDFITLTDEEGNEFELEHLDTLEFEGETYMAFLPADMDEEDPDYGIIILKVIEENGEEILGSVDDEDELDRVYERFMEVLFADEEEEAEAEAEEEEE